MKKAMKLVLVCITCLISICILYLAGVLVYTSLTEFRPAKIENLTIGTKGMETVPVDSVIRLMTWNIGYAGLGKEMDFFYEGGKKVYPKRSLQKKYMDGIKKTACDLDSMDFVFLQEVDYNSERSYSTDEAGLLADCFPGFNRMSAINYNSKYVPVPLLKPMGKVLSGIVIFSAYKPEEAVRLASPVNYSWPKRLFMLKRCFIETHYRTDDHKELILINLHNSAYDDANALRKAELSLLKSILESEYSKGNYVIAGGDWNQNPPGCDLSKIKGYRVKTVRPLDPDFLPQGWHWMFDPDKPTNRDVGQPFDKSATECTIIDYFVTSPNIKSIAVKTMDLGFENSDHNPVILEIKLLNNESLER